MYVYLDLNYYWQPWHEQCEKHRQIRYWPNLFGEDGCILAKVFLVHVFGSENFTVFFSPETLAQLFLLKKVKPFPERRIIKRPTFDNLFPPLRNFRRRMTTAITFSRQNDAGSRARTT